MMLPRLILLVAGILVALLGVFGPESYFNAKRPADIPFYRRICVAIGFIIILVALFFAPVRHH